MNRKYWQILVLCAGALLLIGCKGPALPADQGPHPITSTQKMVERTEPSQGTATKLGVRSPTAEPEEPYPPQDSKGHTPQYIEPYPYPVDLATPIPVDLPTPTRLPTPASLETEMQATSAPLPTLSVGSLPPRLDFGSLVTISFIDMIDVSNGWAIGGQQDPRDHILRTKDGGQTWIDVTPPYRTSDENVPGEIRQAYFLDDQVGWVAVYYLPIFNFPEGFRPVGIVWRTRDGGLSWEAGEPLELILTLYVSQDHPRRMYDPPVPPFIQFFDNQHGLILVRDVDSGMHHYYIAFYTTGDGGKSWEKMIGPDDPGPHSCYKTGMAFADAQSGWLTESDCPLSVPALEITQDGGHTWTSWEKINLPPPEFDPTLIERAYCVDAHSPHLFTPNHGAFIVDCRTSGGEPQPPDILYQTEDGGQTWQTKPYPGGELLFLNPQTGWALGRDIFRTFDGGSSWEKVKTVNWDGQFDFVDENTGFAVARLDDQLALVRTFDGGRTWQILEPVVGP